MNKYEKLLEEIHAEFPRFTLVPKAESRFMRFLGLLLRPLLGGTFLRDYTTTVGQTVYTPTSWEGTPEKYRLEILRHERVHLRQIQRWTPLGFSLAYLLLPFPIGFAWCRARFEWEAYEESMRVTAEHYGAASLTDKHREVVVGIFVGSAYGWMMPFRAVVERWYDEARARITLGF